MTNPESAAPAQSSEQPQGGSIALERPGSVVPPGSKFYVVRHSDEVMERALQRKGTIILIKGGRQMGMTSLIVRSLDQVRAAGAITVYTDLGSSATRTLKVFSSFILRWLIPWPINWTLKRKSRTGGATAARPTSTSSDICSGR